MEDCHRYNYGPVLMEFVIKNIDEFIIPENQKACLLLWSKNIFTVMTNNYDNDFSWITISDLSEENEKIFADLSKTDNRLGHTWGGRGFRINIKPEPGRDTYEEFKELIDQFAYQDVQKEGYITIEEFMRDNTDCYKKIRNPKFKYIKKPKRQEYDDPSEFSKAFDRYVESTFVPVMIRVMDETKMIKSFQEYVDDSRYKGLYDPDTNRVYLNKTYYKAHMNYKNNIKLIKL